MEVSCPKLFEHKSNSQDNIIAQQRERLLAMINLALGENEDYNRSVIERVEETLFEFRKPANLNPRSPDNIIEQRDSIFEKLCLLLEEAGTLEPSRLTAYQFYKRIELIKEKNRAKNVRDTR